LCDSPDIEWRRDQDWSWRPDYDARLHPTIRWMSCRTCAHQFTWGHHTPEAFEILFGHAQPGQTPKGMTASDIEAARPVWGKVVDAVSVHRATGHWLDVGAGSGMLAGVAHECGFDVETMESRPQVAESLRARGFRVRAGDLMELPNDAPDAYDVISLCDVLEHMPFPGPALQAVGRALRDGGVLFLSCPNVDSLAWQALDLEGVNPYWSEIEHLHNFSYRRLRDLLSEYGFEPVSCSVSNRYRVCMDVLARKREPVR
jgi:SAM-dependent methyltransferase